MATAEAKRQPAKAEAKPTAGERVGRRNPAQQAAPAPEMKMVMWMGTHPIPADMDMDNFPWEYALTK